MSCAEGGWHRSCGAGALEAGGAAFRLSGGLAGFSAASLPYLVDADGSTPLHICARRNWPDGVRWLLHRHHLSLRSRDAAGRDAMHVAATYGHYRVLRVLLVNGASAKHTCSSEGHATALMAAARAEAAAAKQSAVLALKVIVLLWQARTRARARSRPRLWLRGGRGGLMRAW